MYFIVRVFLSYGLDELIPKMRLTLPLRFGRRLLFWMPNRHKDKPLGERLRLALQELGPVWIKFGQMMSTRRDLFPPQIADQLTLLQDRVAPFDGALARKHIELAMGGPLETWFDDFDQQPLASASIAQVHTARLKTTGRSSAEGDPAGYRADHQGRRALDVPFGRLGAEAVAGRPPSAPARSGA